MLHYSFVRLVDPYATDCRQKDVKVDDLGTHDARVTRGRAVIYAVLVEPGLFEGPEGVGAEIVVPACRNDKRHFECPTGQKVLRL